MKKSYVEFTGCVLLMDSKPMISDLADKYQVIKVQPEYILPRIVDDTEVNDAVSVIVKGNDFVNKLDQLEERGLVEVRGELYLNPKGELVVIASDITKVNSNGSYGLMVSALSKWYRENKYTSVSDVDYPGVNEKVVEEKNVKSHTDLLNKDVDDGYLDGFKEMVKSASPDPDLDKTALIEDTVLAKRKHDFNPNVKDDVVEKPVNDEPVEIERSSEVRESVEATDDTDVDSGVDTFVPESKKSNEEILNVFDDEDDM
ncbi:hypothetical protein EQG49_13370 [Periweissella cryptocerci]|uniref:Uncharacterized protein n=1 Tax=Periweissella cryptocerci TaxID=2506420 RepID=A0A4P6YX54_9LACO|nr:hypothetical protein [Periweissella cryptocerci]QBO37387.1 hypothetical protein EQG49_13370 [Periweissella cryptocerci]